MLGKAGSYASLLFAADSSDASISQFSQSINERLTAISTHLLFFTLELNRLEEVDLQEKLKDPALAHWQPYLRDIRMYRPHQLSDDVEKVLLEKSVTGGQAWCRLFDETIAALRVTLDGQEITVGDALNRLSDTNRATREQAGKAVGDVFEKMSACLRLSPTRWPRINPFRITCGILRGQPHRAIFPTWWKMRWWMHLCLPCGLIIRVFPTAIML